MNRKEVIAAVKEVVALANSKYPKLCLPNPTVSFYRRGTSAGRVYIDRCHVEFNEVLAKENREEFYKTIIHEVAHLVTYRVYPYAKQAHGPEFKFIDRVLGGKGTRGHDYDVSSVQVKRQKTRYEVKCGCKQTHWVPAPTANKIGNSTVSRYYKCQSCGHRVELTGKSKVIV